MKTEIIQVLASFVGSFGFAVLYNLRGRKLCMAGISGMVSWIAYLVAWNEMPSVFAANLAAAAVATVYAETMARILKTPVTVFLITGIIPVQCPYFPFILPIFGSLLYLRKPFQLCMDQRVIELPRDLKALGKTVLLPLFQF